jgi:hypothetical protein
MLLQQNFEFEEATTIIFAIRKQAVREEGQFLLSPIIIVLVIHSNSKQRRFLLLLTLTSSSSSYSSSIQAERKLHVVSFLFCCC